MSRLGSTAARLKLKGIDGVSHKRWTMWLNSMISEEPHQGKTSCRNSSEKKNASQGGRTGVARLSSACTLRRSVKSGNMRNPYPVFYMSQETAFDKKEEGGDDAKSA